MSDKFYLGNASYEAAKVALDGLSMRQATIAQNMANVDTPGYQAQTVSFEDAVKAVMDNDSSFKMKTTDNDHISASSIAGSATTQFREGGSNRADENNVDVDVEMVDMTETELRYQTITKLVSGKFSLLKEIINSR